VTAADRHCAQAIATDTGPIHRTYFPVDPPARATVRVGLGHPDFLIEIQATAVIG
jgi:enamine deaminase RidA (YjgF/YER057c/UK114 family)